MTKILHCIQRSYYTYINIIYIHITLYYIGPDNAGPSYAYETISISDTCSYSSFPTLRA